MDLELQKALFDLFKKHLKFPFYEGIKDVPFPYGAINYSTLQRLNTKTSKGYKATYQIDLFSNYNGTKEIKEMANLVIGLLEEPFFIGEKRCTLNDFHLRVQLEDAIHHGILETTFELY